MPTQFITPVNGEQTQASDVNQYGVPVQNVESGATFYAVATGGANAYQVTLPASNVISTYTEGLPATFLANASNTGPATLQVNSLSPQSIVKDGGTPLAGGEIAAGQVVSVIYAAGQFQLVSGVAGIMGGVASFNGRTGAVEAAAGDYTFSQIAGAATASEGGTGHASYAQGDLLVATGATTLARLPVGSDGQVLAVSGTEPAWISIPAQVYRPFVQPIYNLDLGGTNTFGMAVCAETNPPILAALSDQTHLAYFYQRQGNRWRPVGSSGIGTEVVGDAPYSLAGPLNTAPRGILYVPSGTGAGRGKFWISSATNESIRVVDPTNLSFTDYPITGPVNAVSMYQAMVFSPDRGQVFAVMGAGTRVACIDAGTVTDVQDATGFSNVQQIALQIDAGVTTKVWVALANADPNNLQWLDPATMAATNAGVTLGYQPRAMSYMSEVSGLFVAGQSTSHFKVVQPAAPYTVLLSGDAEFATFTVRVAYMASVGMVAIPAFGYVQAVDRATGTRVGHVISEQWGPESGNNLNDILYDPTFQEFYVGGTDRPWLFVGI